MVKHIEKKLVEFQHCFSRVAPFRWFVVIIIGFLTRTDDLGCTSFIRSLSLHAHYYESLVHFFRSTSYTLDSIKKTWHQVVRKDGRLYCINGRILLLGDGTKKPKEGKKMPAVKKLFQESENSSKAQYIMGHLFGGLAAVIHHGDNYFGIPLDINIQDGLKETATWEGGSIIKGMTHVVQMIHSGYEAAVTLGSSYLVLDRYFLTVPVLMELDRLNQKQQLLDIITRAKNSCIAYKKPEHPDKPKRGRPRKKGESLKLSTLFVERASDFIAAKAMMYGKETDVKYLCLNLLWGNKFYKELRFVLVKTSCGNAIFVSTDLSLDPVRIIEAYAHRFKIELTFRELAHQMGGFAYRFWTMSMPKLNGRKKKSAPSELSTVKKEDERRKILAALEATERYVLFSCIALGIAQMMALTPSMAETFRKNRYLRTCSDTKVSEATVREYLSKNIFRLLHFEAQTKVTRFIQSAQFREKDCSEEFFD